MQPESSKQPATLATLSFDQRLAKTLRSHIQTGDPLGGRFDEGASYLLPPSGDGGETQDYGRQGHAAGKVIESVVKVGELGEHCYAFSDGMRAIAAASESLGTPSDTVLLHRSVYGGTERYFTREEAKGRLKLGRIDLTAESVADEIRQIRPKLIVGETVSNPLMEVADLLPIMEAARDVGAYMLLDNTLATGRACLPTEVARAVGYDKLLVVLSLTKGYTGGKLSGAVVTDNPELAQLLFEERRCKGGALPSESCPKLLEGFKSMGVRMEQMARTTQALVEYLSGSSLDGIEVLHPMVARGRQRELAERYLVSTPSIFTLRCELPQERFEALTERLSKVFLRANSFNGPYPMMSESAKQSHASIKGSAAKEAAGVGGGLIRLSPGSTETTEGLVDEVKAALADWLRNTTFSRP